MPRCACILAAVLAAGCSSSPPQIPDGLSESSELGLMTPPRKVAVVPPPAPPVRQPPPSPAPVAPPPQPQLVFKPTETDVLVQEFARMKRLAPAELAREQDGARSAYNQTRSDPARVRYAMALSIPGAPGSDDARALEVLDPVAKTPGASLYALAMMITSYVQEQRRLATQLIGLQQSVHTLQQNVQALQHKLDALKTLEKSLTGRDAPRRRPQ